MSLLDIDENNHDLLLHVLSMIYCNRWGGTDRDKIIFKLDLKHDLSRIRYPDRYYIYYDYIAVAPGKLHSDDGKLTVEFYVYNDRDIERHLAYPLCAAKNFTLEDVYNFYKENV